jgi:poly-gamma-glutamate synthesis protein (capsule biosynthesis protein)
MNTKKKNSIRVGLMGDVMIGRLVNLYLNDAHPADLWGDLIADLKNNQLNLINLEAAITTSDKIVPKVFNFKADPQKVNVLKEGFIHVANLANNHILDYSEEGLLETVAILDQAGISHVGAGRNIQEASKPVIQEIRGVKIGILGCTDNEPSWLAADKRPGVKYVEVGDLGAIEKDIEELRRKVHLLILSMHWGPNMRERPPESFRKFAHELLDRGVDVIHGHSAHIFQGVELYRGKLILYDTGDFVDDYAVDPFLRNDRSFLFLLEVGEKGVQSLRLVPTIIERFQVLRSYGKEAKETLQRMQRLSKEMGTDLEEVNGELSLRL